MEILKKAQKRTAEDNRALRNTVSEIIDRITEEGDAALREYSEKFDGFRRASFRVSREEIDRAYEMMTAQEIQDLKDAKANIRAFAEAQRGSLTEVKDFSPQPGIFLSDRVIPVQSCL